LSTLAGRLGAIPARWRWVGLVAVAALAVLLVWFFLFRDSSGSSPSSTAGPPPVRPALGRPVQYANYTAAVDEALAGVRDAGSLQGDERRKKLEGAAASLEKVEGASVEPPAGGISEVDNTAIISELRSQDPNLAAVEGSLSTLSQGLRESQTAQTLPGTLDGGKAGAELQSVLSDPAFDYEKELSLLERLAQWLGGQAGEADPGNVLWRLLTALMAGLAGAVLTFFLTERVPNRWARLGLSAVGGLLVGGIFYVATGNLDILVGILGAVGLVVAAIAAGLISTGLYRASAPARARTLSDLAAALGMSAGQARSRAEEAAAAGDYRHAIRYRCLAVLLALDEVGMLAFDRTATDREYLFRAPGPLQDEMQPLLARFEEVWYGDAPAGAGEWSDFSARAARIEARVAAEGRAGKQAATGRSAA
jgi:hypothetical protein